MSNKLRTTSGGARLDTLTASITNDSIKASLRNDPRRCLVATAIQRKLPKATRVHVTDAHINFTWDGLRYRFKTPGFLAPSIVFWDDKGFAKPFDFTISGPRVAVGGPGSFIRTHVGAEANRLAKLKYYKRKKAGAVMQPREYPVLKRVHGSCSRTACVFASV